MTDLNLWPRDQACPIVSPPPPSKERDALLHGKCPECGADDIGVTQVADEYGVGCYRCSWNAPFARLLPTHEPPADVEAVLEAYDACWIEDERIAERLKAPTAETLKAARERFNAARAAVLAAMQPSQTPVGPLCAVCDHIEALHTHPGLKASHAFVEKSAQPPCPVPPLDDEVRWILGRPNFACASIAAGLRLGGHVIERKAEQEQAAVIHWMLTMYVQHGADWRGKAESELHTMRSAPTKRPDEAPSVHGGRPMTLRECMDAEDGGA